MLCALLGLIWISGSTFNLNVDNVSLKFTCSYDLPMRKAYELESLSPNHPEYPPLYEIQPIRRKTTNNQSPRIVCSMIHVGCN